MKQLLENDYEAVMGVMRPREAEMWEVVLGRRLSADSGDVDQHERVECSKT